MNTLLVQYPGPIEEAPQLIELERDLYGYAKAQIELEIGGAKYDGPAQEAMIRYRELALAQRISHASFVLKAMIIKEIEEHSMWLVHPENLGTAEASAYSLSNISQSEYQNIKMIWGPIGKYAKELGISIEAILQSNPSNLRKAIPLLTTLATGNPSPSKRVNLRAEQLKQKYAQIASSKGDIDDSGDIVNAAVFEDVITNLESATAREFQKHLDPYRPENSTDAELTKDIYDGVVIHRNGIMYIVIEADQDGLESFMNAWGYRRAEVFNIFENEDIMNVPLIKRLVNGNQT